MVLGPAVNDASYNVPDPTDAVEEGVVEFKLDAQTPRPYYMSDNDEGAAGIIEVYNIEEATKSMLKKKLGKKTYKASNGNFQTE